MVYQGPEAQMVLGQTKTLEGQEDSSYFVSLTDRPIRTIRLDDSGSLATWIEGQGLLWEADGTRYLVGGTRLSLEEAERVATSLH
jgi:hypothetical protein